MTDWQELEQRYMMQAAKRLPVTMVRGKGTRLWDDRGRSYLDFLSGIAVTALGHAPEVLVAALQEQAGQLITVSNLVYTAPQVELARLLVENSALDRAFFCNSGAEANEAAIKLARKWGRQQREGASEIICAENGFHGRTLTTVTAGGTERYKAPFAPLPPGFVHVPYDDMDAIQQATSEHTCAVLLEPIQGEAGVVIPSEDYLRCVREWCSQRGVLLMLDEVQTGMGRTGSLFAYQQAGAEPDVMTLAKGLGGGVPIGAMLVKEHCAVFEPGDHGSTFGGNPLACAAGVAVLRSMLEQDLPAQAAKKGELLHSRLRGMEDRYGFVKEVRGRGLLWAVEFEQEEAAQVVNTCLERGLLLNAVKPTAIRLMPPLTVSEAELEEAVAVLDGVLGEMP